MNVWIIVGVVLALLVIYVVGVYNGLIRLRNKVDDQASQIDVQLKRRFDLIPNLVETVKGYTKHEKETLEGVIAARNAYNTAGNMEDQLKADGELTKAMNKLFALAEAYPDLKANENFTKLQEELSAIEEKIVYSRQFYNDSVLKLNNKIEMFPSNIVAGIFGFKKRQFFEAAAEERQNVQVKF
jgi:LemA protein